MIEGMTGFGRATAGKPPFRWTVEIRSLNHRFFDFSVRLPNSFSVWEADLEKLIGAHLKRGKVTMSASLLNEKTIGERLTLDETKLDFYVRTFKRIAKRYRLGGELGIREFIHLPNLFTADKKDVSHRYWAGLKAATQEAFRKLQQMRLSEGRTISKDLLGRAGKISCAVQTIERVSKKSPSAYHEGLLKRIQALDEKIKLDPDRLAREVAFLAERSDITEEVVRAKHHLESFTKSLGGNGEAGKKLEFIVQEIHREVNTIASKAQNFGISDEVVRVKSELEKIREQIQNIV